VSDPGKAVFLSYASQDAEAARRICEALRAAGVEVWFDQNELVGGDTWDAKIRGQIGSCALFLPIISANSQARLEGYFRREWKQAAARTHDMADEKTFLLPVVIDDTRDAEAKVPSEFKAVQWTRLPGGETTRTFCDRVRQLVNGEAAGARADRSPELSSPSGRVNTPGVRRWAKVGSVLAVAGLALAGWLFLREDRKETVPAVPPSAAATAPVSEARGLALRAAALLQDPMMVKESVLAAEELCARAVALDPQDGEAWAVYALVAAELIGAYGDKTTLQIENARSRAERAIRLAPDSVNAALALAHFEVFVDRSAKGTEDRLRSLWARAPEEKRIAKLLSLALIGQGRVDESDAILDEAARRPGGNYLALARRGWSLFHTGRWGGVEAAFDASLALQPNREAYHGKLIFLHAALGDLDRTRALLESLPPGQLREDRVAYVGYRTWMGLREPDRAIEAVRRINRDFINEGQIELPVRFGVGEAHQLAGRPQAAAIEWAAALVSVEQRLKAEPADADLVRWRTLLQARLGRLEEAERSFGLWRELRGIRPEETSRLDAQVLLALGRPDEAVAVLSSRMSPAADQARFAAMYYLTLRNNPAFDPLRGRSDFVAAMKQGEAVWRDFLVKAGLPAPAGKGAPARATGPAR